MEPDSTAPRGTANAEQLYKKARKGRRGYETAAANYVIWQH